MIYKVPMKVFTINKKLFYNVKFYVSTIIRLKVFRNFPDLLKTLDVL